MAAPRLPLRCPIVLRPALRAGSLAAPDHSSRLLQRPPPRVLFRTSIRCHALAPGRPSAASVAALEPKTEAATTPAPPSTSESGSEGADGAETASKASQIGKDYVSPAEEQAAASAAAAGSGAQAQSSRTESSAADQHASTGTASTHPLLAGATPEEAKLAEEYHTNSALTTILSMKPPMSQDSSEDKPPHLQAPPYVHHFDTYSLVKSLQDDGGWTEPQSIEAMKAVRALLTLNMEIARDGLVSKSDAEMESYLFRSACSELRTEVRQRRQTLHTEMQSARTGLQHEVDILTQRIGQETASMKDEIKGMFDERKMIVREDRRSMESRIQELNYKITLALNSEMRSEAEGLRFVITRRAVIALAIVVISAMVALRFAKSAENKSQNERKRLEEAQRIDRASPGSPEAIDMSHGEVMRRIDAGDSPGLVSLG